MANSKNRHLKIVNENSSEILFDFFASLTYRPSVVPKEAQGSDGDMLYFYKDQKIFICLHDENKIDTSIMYFMIEQGGELHRYLIESRLFLDKHDALSTTIIDGRVYLNAIRSIENALPVAYNNCVAEVLNAAVSYDDMLAA
jgi:hypothetical protein